MSSTAVVLGEDVASSEPVLLPQASRLLGTYLIGANGTGKTTLIENLIAQDIAQGLGLCVLDPHGDLIEAVLQRGVGGRANALILWDLADAERPFGLNLFACHDPSDEHLVGRLAEELVQVFKKVWGEGDDASWGPRLEDLLRNVAVTLISTPGLTLLEIPRLLSDRSFRDTLVGNVRTPAVADFWRYEYDPETDKEQREHRASTLNKVRSFLINPIVRNTVGQSESSLDIPQIMAESQVLLVKLALGRVGALPVSLLGSVVVAQLFNAAMARVGTNERPQFNLYLDEYHRFATPAVSELLTEVRKFGVGTTIAHEARYQLDTANRGASFQSGNIIVFRVSGTDADELANAFDATPPPAEVTGYKPIQAIAPQAVEFLLQSGHSNVLVREFIEYELKPLADAIRASKPDGRFTKGSPRGRYTVSQYQITQGLRAIDHYLVAMMERRVEPSGGAREIQLLLDAIEPLRWWLGVGYPGVSLYDNEMTERQEQMLGYVIAEITGRVRAGRRAEPPDDLIKTQFAMREAFGAHSEEYAPLETIYSWYHRLNYWIGELVQVGRILHEEPMLVNTGQMEPIYGLLRSYADVQAQIANELANLPRFTARCKLLVGEHTIRTIPSPVSLGSPLGATALAEINAMRERSRLTFGTPREMIMDEIEQRQQLRAIAEPVPEAELPPDDQPPPSDSRWDTDDEL